MRRPDQHQQLLRRSGPPAPGPTGAVASRPDGQPLPHWLAGFQPAGNQAIGTLISDYVQRQPTPSPPSPTGAPSPAAPAPTGPAPLLDDKQVSDAQRFYSSQPWLYTKAIIEQLRTALSLEPAGGVDAALVLAVARYQTTEGAGDPALKVDGMAGPRTLPRIFRGGLNRPGQGRQFSQAVQTGVIDEWAKLGTAEERLKKLVELVNAKLAAAGVPAVTEGFDTNPTNDGSFDFGPWKMLVGKQRLGTDTISADDASEVSRTVFHEARHTEQWFRMAQLRAGQGLSASAIATEQGIPARIARLARANPLRRGTMEAVIAQGWWDSVYGAGANKREAVLTELDAADKALTAARAKLAKNHSAANQALVDKAEARNDKAFEAYRNLPEENDAWATEAEAAEGIKRGSPRPKPAPAAGPTGEGIDKPAGSPPAPGPSAHERLPEANLP
jgi:hypothetical protein